MLPNGNVWTHSNWFHIDGEIDALSLPAWWCSLGFVQLGLGYTKTKTQTFYLSYLSKVSPILMQVQTYRQIMKTHIRTHAEARTIFNIVMIFFDCHDRCVYFRYTTHNSPVPNSWSILHLRDLHYHGLLIRSTSDHMPATGTHTSVYPWLSRHLQRTK